MIGLVVIWYLLACLCVSVSAKRAGASEGAYFILSLVFTPVFCLMLLAVEVMRGKQE